MRQLVTILCLFMASLTIGCATHSPNSGVFTHIVGYSHEGTPIALHRFGSGPSPLLIVGGIHGDERISADVADAFVDYLKNKETDELVESVAIIARANPDGLAHNSRPNIKGVDCNRNFPASNWQPKASAYCWGGPSPSSEPETRAIITAVRLLAPRAIVSIHAIRNGRECNNFDGPAQELAELMSRVNAYPVIANLGYPTPGSLGSWAGIDLGIPVVTLELPRGAKITDVWSKNRDALLAAIQADHDHIGK